VDTTLYRGERRVVREFASRTTSGEANEAAVLIGVFGFICPMVFGMAYLLLPSYVGETLVDQRLAGIHFVLAYVGVILLVADQLGD